PRCRGNTRFLSNLRLRSYKMKLKVLLSVLITSVSALAILSVSWAQCPEAPFDLGICDTMYIEPWAYTDTCFDYGSGITCINQPGKEFPCFLHVSLFVTHDSNTFWWPTGGTFVQDSVSAF